MTWNLKRFDGQVAAGPSSGWLNIITIPIPDQTFNVIDLLIGGSSVDTNRPGGCTRWLFHIIRNDSLTYWLTNQFLIKVVGTWVSGTDYQVDVDSTNNWMKVNGQGGAAYSRYFVAQADVQTRDNS